MKKFYTMLLAMMALMLTACDNDDAVAYTLEGTWKGNMYISSSYGGHTYDATYSEITFLRDPYRYSSGAGYWVDYYSNAPWDYVANHIEWTVDRGTIHVYFREEDTSLEIWDYHLDDNRFYGTIRDGGNRVEFELYHTSSPNWNNYRWGYDSWDYYYARSASADDRQPEKPVRMVRSL